MCAVIKRGILGGFQNKIANVVGGSWKGISYMRSLPISVSNPQTAAQTTQRGRFRAAVAFSVGILAEVIKPLWDRFAQYQSGYNAFVSENISRFSSSGLTSPSFLVISKGTLAIASLLSAVVDASAHTAIVTWTASPGGDANADDELFLVVNNDTTKTAEGFNTGVHRSVGTATVTTTIAVTASNSIWVYAAFRKADGTKVSNTDKLNVNAVA